MINDIYLKMIEYYGTDAKRSQHFAKVHAYARLIGQREGLSERELYILEAAALVHDIGIKPAEELYGSSNGKLQQELGGKPARELLEGLGEEEDVIERVCFLVEHHHTYSHIEGMDYRILVEADVIVNIYEDELDHAAAQSAYDKIFKTSAGRSIMRSMYAVS